MIISQPNADFLALAVAMSPAILSMTDIGPHFRAERPVSAGSLMRSNPSCKAGFPLQKYRMLGFGGDLVSSQE